MIHIITEDDWSIRTVLEGPEIDLKVWMEKWVFDRIGPKPKYDKVIVDQAYEQFRKEHFAYKVSRRKLSYNEMIIELTTIGFKILQYKEWTNEVG